MEIEIADENAGSAIRDEADQNGVERGKPETAFDEGGELVLPRMHRPAKEKGDHIGVGEDLQGMDERMKQMLMPWAFFLPFDLVPAAAMVALDFARATLKMLRHFSFLFFSEKIDQIADGAAAEDLDAQ